MLDGLIAHLDVTNVQLRSSVMLQAIEQSGHPAARVPWNLALKHVDNTAYDLSELVRSTAGRDQSDNALALLEVSPHSQYAKAVLIEKDWERARPHLAEWEKGANNAPVLLAALARRYSDQGQVEEARRALLRYIQFSPDQWAYELLAKDFKDRRRPGALADDARRVPRQDGGQLAEPDRVRVQIADYFMGLGQWDKAWPYAQAAAGTGVQWALLCAAQCAEGRKDWVSAERYTRQITENNPGGGWAAWYLFCKRTGHGDAEAAGAFAERVLRDRRIGPARRRPRPSAISTGSAAIRRRPAPTSARRTTPPHPHVMCIPLILIADQLGDAAARDEWIQTLLTRHRNQSPNTARIFEILRKAASQSKLEAIDLQAIDQILGKINAAASRGNNEFFVGCYLKNHGKVEEARRHLEHGPQVDRGQPLHAGHRGRSPAATGRGHQGHRRRARHGGTGREPLNTTPLKERFGIPMGGRA